MRNSKSRYSQMMIALFVAIIGIIITQNYGFVNQSFISSIFSVVISIFLLLVCITPSLMIKRKSNLSFIGFAKRESPSAMIFLSMFYALYFIYAIVNFLLRYSSVFTSTGNRSNVGFFVIFALLAVCVFASFKGIGAVARCSLFVFAFALVAFALIFGGNIAHLDFSSFKLDFSTNQLQYGSAVFAMIVFAAVIFGFFEYNDRIKVRNVFWFVCGIALLLLVVLFFVFFVLGEYGTMQSYQIFVLSKSAEFGDTGGIDSFHLALCVMSVFVLVSLSLICIGRVVERDENIWCMAIFAAIAYVLYLTADYYNAVKEIILNPYVFDILTVFASFVLPMTYIIIFRRRLDA